MRALPIASVILLLTSTLAHADARTDAAIELRLKKARETFAAAVDAAKRHLREEYDSAVQAYARSGNLDQALATRKARDQAVSPATQPAFADVERADVTEGWTILFRSPDPLVWNIPVRNRTMAAAPVSAAPHDTRFLRMRRMDTGDAVIIPCTYEQLTTRTWPIDHPTFRGDRCLASSGRMLGIVDPRTPAADASQTPILDVTPIGQLSGWGFAIRDNAPDYCWESKSIPPTAFEISVTARDLSSDEQKLLVKP